MVLFLLGAIVMRGAGCTYNDIVDRDLDAKVARTARRPIPSGAVTPRQAAWFMAAQLLVGLAILLQFNRAAILLGVASLLLIFTYPFMKRLTFWPQAWLGLAFNWGALLGWCAATGSLGWPPVILYAAGIAWTLGYDTIYALQDKEDDQLVGIKSTALRFAENTPRWLVLFFALTILLVAAAGWAVGLAWPFYAVLIAAMLHAGWQIATLDMKDPRDCLTKFRSNRWFGWLIFGAILSGKLL